MENIYGHVTTTDQAGSAVPDRRKIFLLTYLINKRIYILNMPEDH